VITNPRWGHNEVYHKPSRLMPRNVAVKHPDTRIGSLEANSRPTIARNRDDIAYQVVILVQRSCIGEGVGSYDPEYVAVKVERMLTAIRVVDEHFDAFPIRQNDRASGITNDAFLFGFVHTCVVACVVVAVYVMEQSWDRSSSSIWSFVDISIAIDISSVHIILITMELHHKLKIVIRLRSS